MNDLKKEELLGAVEAVLFACGEPIGADKIAAALGVGEAEIREITELLCEKFNTPHSGIHLLVLENDLLRPEGVLIFEHSKKMNFSAYPEFWQQRSYGSVQFSFFRRQ